jgi:hypothetical protein
MVGEVKKVIQLEIGHVLFIDIVGCSKFQGRFFWNNNEKAFQLLEQAYAEHSFHFINLNVCPQFKSVRPDPRFQDLVQRVGLSR